MCLHHSLQSKAASQPTTYNQTLRWSGKQEWSGQTTSRAQDDGWCCNLCCLVMTASGPAGSAQLTCAGSLSLKDRSRPIRDTDDLYLEVRHGARTLSKRVTISTEYLRLANFSFTGFLKNDTNVLAQGDSHVVTKLPTRQCTSVKIQSPRRQQLLEARARTHTPIHRT